MEIIQILESEFDVMENGLNFGIDTYMAVKERVNELLLKK